METKMVMTENRIHFPTNEESLRKYQFLKL